MAIVWGGAIMLAIYVVGGISGAHINPAITLALALWNHFPRHYVFPYLGSQLAGAFLAAAVLFFLYRPHLEARERELKVERGQDGSEVTAACYGEYFPNPGAGGNAALYAAHDYDALHALVGPAAAFVAEFLGTLFLALAVFALTDEHNTVCRPATWRRCSSGWRWLCSFR